MQSTSPTDKTPPTPPCRERKVSLRTYFKLFRQDILSAQPAHLYHAWMAEMRAPFFRSYLCNDPALVDHVLKEDPGNFPKSERLRTGLKPLLGESIFISNGPLWEHQRRIIDPAFEGGRLQISFRRCGTAALLPSIGLRRSRTGVQSRSNRNAAMWRWM